MILPEGLVDNPFPNLTNHDEVSRALGHSPFLLAPGLTKATRTKLSSSRAQVCAAPGRRTRPSSRTDSGELPRDSQPQGIF